MALWIKTRICQTFPAYRLCDVDESGDGPELLRAMELLGIEREVEAARRG